MQATLSILWQVGVIALQAAALGCFLSAVAIVPILFGAVLQ